LPSFLKPEQKDLSDPSGGQLTTCIIVDLGIVGCGAVAGEHLRTVKRIEDLKPVAVCDTNRELASKTSKEWNVDRFYTNFEEMLEGESLSIVSILTPPRSHAPLCVAAVKRGVNILVEKPFTVTTHEANEVLDSLKGSRVKLTVDHNWLFNNAVKTALSYVKSGSAGEVLGMSIECLHTTDDHMAADRRHWCHTLPGGRIGEMLPHPAYVLQTFLGDALTPRITLAGKRGPRDWMRSDELYVALQGSTGMGQVYVSFNAPRPSILIDIYCTRKVLRVDLLNQTFLKLGHRTFSKAQSGLDVLGISSRLLLQTAQNVRYLLHGTGEEAIHTVYTSLMQSIATGQPPMVTPEAAYNTVDLVEQICRDMQS